MNVELILVLILLTNLRLLASSRLGAAIRMMALQGILLGVLPLLAHTDGPTWRGLGVGLGSVVLKGFVFQWLLFRALRQAEVDREIQPYVGYVGSVLIGVVCLAGSFAMSTRLPGLPATASPLVVPVALFSILAGLFLLVSRRHAVNQVLGFIVLENGAFIFGVGVMGETSLLVEMGVLLDVFVAVFIMGIMLFHISREFDEIDTDRLSQLKDV